MIALLTGRPIALENHLILDVSGVGYKVNVTARVLVWANSHPEKLTLYIHTRVTDDAITLYGFVEPQEQELFELFLQVSGVGPSTALHLMDRPSDQLVSAVQEADVAFFSAVPRVGRKLAQKIIIELRDKLGELKQLNLAPLTSQQQTVSEALEALGFNTEAVRQALSELDLADLSEEAAIKKTIQHLSHR